jgi:hypothetical protein
MRTCPLAILISLCGASGYAQQPDVKALIRKSVENYERDWRTGMRWSYTQTDLTRSEGGKEVEVVEVLPIEGTPYDHLVSKDGKPLSAEEKRKEDQKYEKVVRQRRAESPAERRARIEKYESDRAFLREIPEAYNFRLIGEDEVNGRPAWVVEMHPKPGYSPLSMRAAMFRHIEGKLWIDKEDVHWAKADAHVIDTISIGWVLARIGPGAHISLDMTRVRPGLWMPAKIDVNGVARVLMVHNKNLNEQLTFSGFKPAVGEEGIESVAERRSLSNTGQSFR